MSFPTSETDISSILGNVTEQVAEERIEKMIEQLSNTNQVLYGCIIQRHFLQNNLRANPFYAKYVLCKDLSKQKVLEVGCCLGTDTRRLIRDGVNVSNVVAVDLNFQFIQLGFQLFEDQEMPIASRFFEKNVAADDLVEFLEMRTSLPPFDIIVANAIIHALSLEDCKKALNNFTRLLVEGGVLIGYLPTIREGDKDVSYKVIKAYQNPRILHSKSHFQELLEMNHFGHVEMFTSAMKDVFSNQQEALEEWQNVDITFFKAIKRLPTHQRSE